MITTADLKTICINTAVKLFDINSDNTTVKLVFPYYRNKNKKRISEQEARLTFISELNNFDVFYAIEVPTTKKYSGFANGQPTLNDKQGISASFDLCLFDEKPLNNNKHPNSINIEFKAHNVECNHIEKDLLKLFAENGDGLFFHLLEKVDGKTLNVGFNKKNKSNEYGIFSKYKISFNNITSNVKMKNKNNHSIMFFVVSLNPKFILSKKISKSQLLNNKTGKIFKIEYLCDNNSSNKISISDTNGWDFIDFSD